MNLEDVKELERCRNEVHIWSSGGLDDYVKQIMDYEDRNEEYRVWIDFYYCSSDVEYKMKVIDMIDGLNINHKVGKILVGLKDDNRINEWIIMKMVTNY